MHSKIVEMERNNRFDSYSPEIQYPQADVAPPEQPRPEPEPQPKKPDSSRKAPKPRKQQEKKVKEKVRKEPAVPFTQRVKEWAGSQTTRWLLGLFLGFFAIYLGVAFLSYLVDCIHDQALVNNFPIGQTPDIANKAGEGGARISEFLINECFGLGSFVIIFWLAAMTMKQLAGKPKFKSVDFTIKSLVALITVSLIVGLLTISLHSPVNWGGYHGRYVNEFVIHFLGLTGAVILCIFMLSAFVVICMRDFINWVIRMRNNYLEKKRKREEKLALQRQREREIEEMRQYEISDARKAGEETEPEPEPEPEDTHVSFADSGYYTLPDFEDEVAVYDTPDESESYNIEDTEPAPQPPVTERQPAVSEVAPVETPAGVSGNEKGADKNENSSDLSMVVNVNEIAQADGSPRGDVAGVPGRLPYAFPPVEYLRPGVEKISVDATEQYENKERIRKTLLDFGIPITSIEATVGPTVTLYEIVPDKGVKIARIRSLVDDIALSLSAVGVRIIAPIPGKGTVGIEVANKDPQTVSMRTVIKSRKFQETKYKLPIALGSTISNDVFIADLAKMPHLLVAGATGQGKSVGLNAIITSLLYKKSPDELKFVMIDPKMVEFSLYAKIEQHYLAKLPDEDEPIITDMSKVVATLSSLCVEMDDRYQLLKQAGSRNIEEYNPKVIDKRLDPRKGHRYLPYIVVVVDEFSDLIMTSGKDVEMPIARLAQKARAVGIHVILATQRPSTNVITGIIRANFPARIAFKVSSGVDSKIILDTSGAQQLIGKGDMLISSNSELTRVQCAFVDTPEVEEICEYISRQPYPRGAYELPEPVVGEGGEEKEFGGGFTDKDPLFDEVARTIVNSSTASTSSLQRRYNIGYNRAGRIMDQLEEAGIVGPSHGGKPRSVLVDAVSLEGMLAEKRDVV